MQMLDWCCLQVEVNRGSSHLLEGFRYIIVIMFIGRFCDYYYYYRNLDTNIYSREEGKGFFLICLN